MGRMHSKGKGLSGSALPYKRSPPSWLKMTAPEVLLQSFHRPGAPARRERSDISNVQVILQVVDHICKMAKKGMTPSVIGNTLRDSHGVAQTSYVTSSKVLRILKAQGTRVQVLLYGSYT